MQLGTLRIDPVVDGIGRGRGHASQTYGSSMRAGSSLLGGDDADWAAHREFLNADGNLDIPAGGFLVRAGGATVLVDAGIGPHNVATRSFLWESGALMSNLSALGVNAEEITDVVFTHLHFDHVGWASTDGQATFPRATYRCDRRDLDYFLPDAGDPPDPRSFELLQSIAQRFVAWDAEGPLLPGIDVLRVPGHTPGSSVLVLASGHERAMLLGDVVHCPVQLLEDEWGALGDVDPLLARRARAALVKELESQEVLAASPHFANMAFGRLVRAGGRRHWSVNRNSE